MAYISQVINTYGWNKTDIIISHQGSYFVFDWIEGGFSVKNSAIFTVKK